MSNKVAVSFGGELAELRKSIDGMGDYIKGWGDNVKAIGVGAFAAWGANEVFEGLKSGLIEVVGLAREFISVATEAAQVDAQLAAVVESTGRAAGFTADELKAMASDLQAVTTYGDEAIKSAQTMILSFRNIKGDQFKAVTALATDMAARLGGEVSDAASQLGRTLNDPIRGMRLLERQGISLSDSQKLVIEQLVKTGDVASAQNILIRELQTVYGGAAAAAADASGGGFMQFWEIVGDIKEALGAGLVPLLDKLAPLAKTIAQHFQEMAGQFSSWGEDVAAGASDWLPAFEDSLLGMIATIEATFAKLFGSIDRAKLSWLEFLETIDKKALGDGPGEATGLAKLMGRDKNWDLTRGLFGDSITGMDDAARKEMERLREATSGGPTFEEDRERRLNELRGLRDRNNRPSEDRDQVMGESFAELQANFKGLSETLMGVGQSVVDGIATVANPIADAGKSIGGQIGETFKDLLTGKNGAIGAGRDSERFTASFEDAQSLFRRIQSSAAGSSPELETARDQLRTQQALLQEQRDARREAREARQQRPGQQVEVVAVLGA